jgi:hypothetical protein
MSQQLEVRGVGWDISAIGNAIWGGAKLSDVLELVGVSKFTSVTSSGGKHVEFTSIDKCKVSSLINFDKLLFCLTTPVNCYENYNLKGS